MWNCLSLALFWGDHFLKSDLAATCLCSLHAFCFCCSPMSPEAGAFFFTRSLSRDQALMTLFFTIGTLFIKFIFPLITLLDNPLDLIVFSTTKYLILGTCFSLKCSIYREHFLFDHLRLNWFGWVCLAVMSFVKLVCKVLQSSDNWIWTGGPVQPIDR